MVLTFRGFRVCPCMDATLPGIEAEMKTKGVIKNSIDIYQGPYNKGGVSASAGTHDGGGVMDVGQYSDAALRIWRQWGVEMQARTRAQGFTPHGHGIWKGCPHLSSGARYQASEWEAGRNGLVNKGPITGPEPKASRTPTWQQAVKNHQGSKPPTAPGGVLGMTDVAKYSTSKGQKFTGNEKWQTVKLTDEGGLTLLTGPKAAFVAFAGFTVADLKAGAVCQFRFQAVSDFPDSRPTVVEYPYPIYELTATSGSSFGQMTWVNSLGSSPKKDAKLRLRLFIAPEKGTTVTVSNVTSRVLY